ncbi:MAG: transporter [Pseudomonadota bacterium]
MSRTRSPRGRGPLSNGLALTVCASALWLLPAAHASTVGTRGATSLLSLSQTFSNGDYGLDVDTDLKATVVKWVYRQRDWGFSLSVPYLDITGPATEIWEDIDTGELFLVDVDDDNREGLGDTVFSVDRVLSHSVAGRPQLKAGVSLKVPTGDEFKGLGNGEFDLALVGSGRVRRAESVFNVSVGYQLMGDTDDIDYNNRAFVAAGVFRQLDRRSGVGLRWQYKQASRDERDDLMSVGAFVTHRLRPAWTAAVNLNVGLSDAVADVAFGVQVSRRF